MANGEQTAATAEPSRRRLMRTVGLGAAGVAAMGALAGGGVVASSTPARAAEVINDVNILNFALNLEYLEAEYYLRAVTGSGLPSSLTTGQGTGGVVIGGTQVPFALPLVQQFAANLAVDEQAHVNFLRAALGSNAVAEPNINLQQSFTTLAQAAGLVSAGQSFNPFADEVSFLLGAFVFEDVGVTAYGGAVGLIQNSGYVTAAAAIQSVEGYHASNIRALLSSIGAGQAAQAISNLRANLSGAQDDQGILMPNGNANIVPADVNALTFRRTPRQVLNIVYGAQNATGGLFFPTGMNGGITS